MSTLTSLTISAARAGLAKKEFTALELTDAYLAAMEKARWRAFRSASRICSPPRAFTPRPAAMCWMASSRLMNPPCQPISGAMVL